MKADKNKKEIWKKRFVEFNTSKLSGRKWCEKENLAEGQFWYWKNRLKELKSKNIKKENKNWVAVEINSTTEIIKDSTIIITIGRAKIETNSNLNITAFENIVKILVKLC